MKPVDEQQWGGGAVRLCCEHRCEAGGEPAIVLLQIACRRRPTATRSSPSWTWTRGAARRCPKMVGAGPSSARAGRHAVKPCRARRRRGPAWGREVALRLPRGCRAPMRLRPRAAMLTGMQRMMKRMGGWEGVTSRRMRKQPCNRPVDGRWRVPVPAEVAPAAVRESALATAPVTARRRRQNGPRGARRLWGERRASRCQGGGRPLRERAYRRARCAR